jgi:hypothetical protein
MASGVGLPVDYFKFAPWAALLRGFAADKLLMECVVHRERQSPAILHSFWLQNLGQKKLSFWPKLEKTKDRDCFLPPRSMVLKVVRGKFWKR